jgi:hypothetical protein
MSPKTTQAGLGKTWSVILTKFSTQARNGPAVNRAGGGSRQNETAHQTVGGTESGDAALSRGKARACGELGPSDGCARRRGVLQPPGQWRASMSSGMEHRDVIASLNATVARDKLRSANELAIGVAVHSTPMKRG